jgi:tetratricopeptide (TPR) repeat protein
MSSPNPVGKIAQRAGWANTGIVALAILLVLSLTFFAYRPALDASFVLDDGRNIVDSPAIRWEELSVDNFRQVLDSALLRTRPVANLSFAFDHLAGGLNPRVFHRTNILIHLAVGCVLLWISWLYVRVADRPGYRLQRSSGSVLLVLVPVGIFLLHPLNTQAVTYIVQRMASLVTLFTLISFASYLMARYRVTSRSHWWYVGAMVAWLLALGTKENAVLLLPVIVAYEACFFRGKWRGRIENALRVNWGRGWTIAFWAILAVVMALAGSLIMVASDGIGLFADFPGRDFNGIERLLTQCRVQLFHLSQLIWPSPIRLNLDHDFEVSRSLLRPLETLPALLISCGLLVAAVALAVHRPRYGFPLVAYALLHSVEAGPVNLEIIFEHRMYLPFSMLVLLLAVLASDGRGFRSVAIATMCAIALLFAGWTHARNEVWAEPLGLERDMALKSPDKARVQFNYALALSSDGRTDEALQYVRRAVELEPGESRHHQQLGELLLDLGRPAEAATAYDEALRLAPEGVRAVLGLGLALQASGDEEAALRHYLDKGVFLARGGRPFEAMPILEAAASLTVVDANVYNALGNTYMAAGMGQRALEQYQLALNLDPDMEIAWYNLGTVADSIGRRDDALRAYEEFLSRAPDSLQQQIMRAQLRSHDLRTGAE